VPGGQVADCLLHERTTPVEVDVFVDEKVYGEQAKHLTSAYRVAACAK
jgi:hypothetical protein